MSVKLYKHNKETYKNIVKMFKTENRVGVVQPTGTGKSFLILKCIEDNKKDNILVLSPSVEIFNQLNNYAIDMSVKMGHVTMYTYSKLNMFDHNQLEKLRFSKIILDEYHRTGAEEWGKSLDYLLEANLQSKLLGLTATPVRYLDNARDMSKELFNDNIARYMTLGEAVERGILPTPIYVPVWYDDGKLDQYQENIELIEDKDKRKEAEEKLKKMKYNLENSYGAEDIFKKYMPTNHGKYIVFCRDEDHLNEMIKQMKVWLAEVNNNVNTYITLSNRSDKDTQIKEFIEDNDNNAIKLLFSVDRLNEGVHVPGIDGVVMLRPTTSAIIYLQQMGRALSSSGKTPVIFDMVNNYQNVKVIDSDGESYNVFEREIYNSSRTYENNDSNISSFAIFEKMVEFNKIFEELDSVLSFDRDKHWEEKFKLLEEFINEFNRCPKKEESYKHCKIGVWLSTQKRMFDKNILSKERQEKLESIGVELKIIKLEENWELKFKLLESYLNEYGKFPSEKDVYNGINIGKWLLSQYTAYNKGKLSLDRYEKLKSIGYDFISHNDKLWKENFELVEEYIKLFGKIPDFSDTFKGKNIGRWLLGEKKKYDKGSLSEERCKKLESIEITDRRTRSWNDNFKILEMYILEYNKFPTQTTIYHDYKIGVWLNTQKRMFDKNILSKERQEKLESIGVEFGNSRTITWNKKFTVLKMYIDEYDKLPIGNEIYHDIKLRDWIGTQRGDYKNNKLSEERYQKLNSIGIYFIDGKTVFKKKDKE